jgi:hypothetical protein
MSRVAGMLAVLGAASGMAEVASTGSDIEAGVETVKEKFGSIAIEMELRNRKVRGEPMGVFLSLGETQYYWVPETAELFEVTGLPAADTHSMFWHVDTLSELSFLNSGTYYSAKEHLFVYQEGGTWRVGKAPTPGLLDKVGEAARTTIHDVQEWLGH